MKFSVCDLVQVGRWNLRKVRKLQGPRMQTSEKEKSWVPIPALLPLSPPFLKEENTNSDWLEMYALSELSGINNWSIFKFGVHEAKFCATSVSCWAMAHKEQF